MSILEPAVALTVIGGVLVFIGQVYYASYFSTLSVPPGEIEFAYSKNLTQGALLTFLALLPMAMLFLLSLTAGTRLKAFLQNLISLLPLGFAVLLFRRAEDLSSKMGLILLALSAISLLIVCGALAWRGVLLSDFVRHVCDQHGIPRAAVAIAVFLGFVALLASGVMALGEIQGQSVLDADSCPCGREAILSLYNQSHPIHNKSVFMLAHQSSKYYLLDYQAAEKPVYIIDEGSIESILLQRRSAQAPP